MLAVFISFHYDIVCKQQFLFSLPCTLLGIKSEHRFTVFTKLAFTTHLVNQHLCVAL